LIQHVSPFLCRKFPLKKRESAPYVITETVMQLNYSAISDVPIKQ
jgi:hypothetical protein